MNRPGVRLTYRFFRHVSGPICHYVPVIGKTNIFSIDVEDWFHILDMPSAPVIAQWDRQPTRIEQNFNRLLELLDVANVKATCFTLSWVAQRFPHLLRDAHARGHEIASHGTAHELVYQQGEKLFDKDIADSKKLLEDTIGHAVHGYRAPGFSVTEDTPFFHESLVKAGYTYDSSIFPASRGHGGLASAPSSPYLLETASGPIWEFPISVATVLNRRICFSGGGYFRLLPYGFIKECFQKTNDNGLPVVFYIHPRDIDPHQPRLPMSWKRHFKSYIGLRGAENKMKRVLQDFRFDTFAAYLSQDRGEDAS